MQHMTIWDVIADPGPAIAPLTEADVYMPAIEVTHLRRYRPRSPMLFDVHADLFPIMQAPAVAQEAPVQLEAMERLVASGIANEYIASLGALRDQDAPWSPRSIGFPVTLHRVGGPFQSPTAPRIWELHLSTPACGDLPFVRRVERVTGLKARWAPEAARGICGQWAHAIDLATDAGWERLASSMEHTTPEAVARSAGIQVCNGSISAANARRLLDAVGVSEPATRAYPNISPNPDGALAMSLGGWEAVHAIEDGLVVPGNPKRHTGARATDAGWRSVGKEPPAPPPPKVKKALIRPPAAEVAYVEAAIQAILPRGVPTYVKEVIFVGRMPRSKHGRRVELVLWDGGIGRLDISGEPGAHGYHWKATGGDGRPFHWNKATRRWARVDEPEV